MKGLTHAQADVRNPAYDCMGELYRLLGEQELSRYYDKLRPAQMEALKQKFAEIDDGGVAPKKKISAPKKSTVDTNIGKTAKKMGQPRQQAQHEPTNHEQEEYAGDQSAKTCQFCDLYDKNFDEETMDLHHYRECVMLTQCWECDNVVEIDNIEEHLLKECP